ncbi:hypothetical protein [Vibrio sp. 1180_3]|uniref:hypothetical protein n=1 Tax=Vibrio sp. 1180_3 TaxID=2528832 RepID=UPI0024053C17|nr:hypothetical protein [Vibrio sp. 1180_3]MDF9399149.1 hypothetical protein [Vibrio sp. 1180_3]
MFQFVTYDDILLIDFAWSLQRDFNEASAAAKDWIEIRELGYRYHTPSIPKSPRISIPQRRWFDVSSALPHDEECEGLLVAMIPVGRRMEELNVEHADELTITPASGWSYINCVRDHYYELNHVSHQEVCRAAIHHGWIQMRKADLLRYEHIARRHDYIYKLMQSLRPQTEDVDGETKLMSVDEFLQSNSISDDEHRKILSQKYKLELESEYENDLLGVDSIVEAMDLQTQSKSRKSSPNRTLHDIASYELASKQITIPL